MTYDLTINLAGAEPVLAALQKLSALTGSLGGGTGAKGSSSQTARDVADIARSMAQGAQSTSKMRSDLDKISSGGGNLGAFKKFPKALQDVIRAQHPELFKTVEATIETAIEQAKSKFRGYGMKDLPKLFKPAVPIIWDAIKENAIGGIQGLRDITGKDLAKIHALGEFGADLKKLNFKSYGMDYLAKQRFASPSMPAFMQNPDFFKSVAKLNIGKILLGLGVGMTGNRFIGSRLLSDELGKNANQGGVAAGLFGKGGIAGFSEIYLGFQVLSKAMEGLKKFVDMLNHSIKHANDLTAKAMTMGLGLDFSIRKGLMAQILGVSEQDVFKYSYALTKFAENVNLATNALVESTKNLTSVQREKNIVDINRTAFQAEAARTYSGIAYLNAKSDVWGTSLDLRMRKWFNDHIMAPLHLLAPKADMILPRMNQLPASTWERMGLVTMGASGNYQREISRNTRDIATGIRTLVAHVTRSRSHSPWNMSPQTSQP